MRILHTGDLHLDSAFCHSGTLGADKRREMQRDTLLRIFELAKTKKCDMMLIAGDLFDSKYVTPETEQCVKELFARTDFPIVIAPGNHDPYVNGSFYKTAELPDNVYIFNSNELQCFEFPELRTRVFGYAFTSQTLTASPLSGQASLDSDGYIRLLCAHADLSSVISRYCPITVGDILNLGVDYAALGHVHNRYEEQTDGLNNIRYCGFPEGRSFDELSDGGVLIVDIDDGNISIKRHKVSMQKYEIRDIDLSECGDRSEMVSKIRSLIEGDFPDGDTHLRLRLTGTADADSANYITRLEGELSHGLLSLEIKNLTFPIENISSLKNDISIRGAFYNALYSGLVDDDPEVRARTVTSLQIGLAAIDGRRIPGEEDEI